MRGLSTLYILKIIMDRLNYNRKSDALPPVKPCDIFDLIEGTSTGGITLGDYLSLLTNQEEEIVALLSEEFEDEGRYRDMKNPVTTTWLICVV